MIIPFKIGDNTFNLSPYTSKQEKDILLLSNFEICDFETIFKTLNFKTDIDLSDDLKKVILYKLREISVGDDVDIRFICDKCASPVETVISATNFVIDPKRNDNDILKLNKEVTDENMQEFVDFDVDELDLNEFEELKQRIVDNQIKTNFTKSCKCFKCSHEKLFEMGDVKYIIEILSEDTLMSLYKSYNFLIYFGHYSKQDVDNMYPFERTIFLGLLNKVKEELGT